MRRATRGTFTLTVLTLTGMAVTGCGSTGGTHASGVPSSDKPIIVTSPDATPPAGRESSIVGGADNQFSPPNPTVTAGADGLYRLTVSVPADSDAHTFQSDTAPFDSGPVAPGQTKTFRFRAHPGKYDFYCLFHIRDGMRGTITLR